MNRTMINPFSQDAHEHPLSDAYQTQEYLCHACKTLGFGTSKRCGICQFDLHEYCATCPPEIQSPKLHSIHSMKLVFQRASATAAATSSELMRVCDVCDDEVDGLYYQCEICSLDVHPLCLQLPPEIRLEAVHPNHNLIFGRHQGGTGSACKICREPCQFWWYRCVQESCAVAEVDIHPECVAKHGLRSLRPRPTLETTQQPQPQNYNGDPTAGSPPSAPPLSSGNNSYNDYQEFLRIHLLNQQYYYSPLHQQQVNYTHQHHDHHLQRIQSYPPVTHHSPHHLQHSHSAYYQFQRPHMQMHNGPANAFGNLWNSPSQNDWYPGAINQHAEASSSPYPQDDGDEVPNGRRRKRLYALVGNLLLSAVTIGIFGVPSFLG